MKSQFIRIQTVFHSHDGSVLIMKSQHHWTGWKFEVVSQFLKKSVLILKPLKTGNPITGTLANREDPEEMSQYPAFHQDLHCLLGHNRSVKKETQYYLEFITCDSSIYQLTFLPLLYVALWNIPLV